MGIVVKTETLQILARKFQRNVEDYGSWVAAKKSLAHLLKLVYYRQNYRIYRIDLSRAPCEADLLPGNFSFRMLAPDDRSEIEQIENLAEWLRGSVRERIGSGDLCLVALHNGTVAGFNLITFGSAYIPLINLTRTFRSRQAWSEHIGVQKEFRQQGLASTLRYRIFDELRQRGFKRLYGGTLSLNVASLKLSRRVGFQEILEVHYTRVLGFQAWRYEKVRK